MSLLQVPQGNFYPRYILLSDSVFRIGFFGCPRLQSAYFPLAEFIV
jgi:hypothetical protein